MNFDKRKPGRPKKRKDSLRNKVYCIRLTEDEEAHLKFAANMVYDYDSVTDYIRDKLFDRVEKR